MTLRDIFVIVQYALFAATISLAFIYSCLIIFLQRFHHRNNAFILNLCINVILTCMYFMIYFKAVYYDMSTALCIFFHYAFNIASIEIPFAFVTFTVHRCFSIVYHTKPLFKTKRWVVICIASQWIIQYVISIPFVFGYYPGCDSELWMGIYTFMAAVFFPIVINIVLNLCIFNYVRRSSRRIQPHGINSLPSNVNNLQPKISRRDIYLLKQMSFMLTMFFIGWIPVSVIHIVDILDISNALIEGSILLLSEICLLSLIINLFLCNHEIKRFLFNRWC